MKQPEADILFEISYEVCNKVGGIYTVLSSKAALMKEKYKEYITIGPYYEDKANLALEQTPVPQHLTELFDELRKEGIECIYGKWQVPGEPSAILVDFRKQLEKTDSIKKDLWDNFGVDTLFCSGDYTEPMVWAWCVGRLLEKAGQKQASKKIVAHFHEWLSGIALLYLKMKKSNVRSVFTTHATMLGRAIAGGGDDLYNILENMNPYDEAKRRGVLDKYTTEKACAKEADVFTTVSEITAIEAEKVLERKADVLVLNGLDIQKFPTIEGTSIKHQETRDVMREFLAYYFFPYYSFDIEQSLTYFILGRNEFRNKGVDIYIKALGELNRRLKSEGSKKTIISFFFIPLEAHGIRTNLIKNKNYYREIKKDVEDQNELVKTRIIRDLVAGRKIDVEKLFPKDFMLSVKKTIQGFSKNESAPPLCTHYLVDENNNEILNALKQEGLLNLEEDKVKVIVYPVYISESDGILGLKYYDVISGGHLGVFPSYYEPWGYTPLECASLAVPSITSDLAGYGRYINKVSEKNEGGIFVLKRFKQDEKNVVDDFVDVLHNFSKLKKPERVKQKLIAKEMSMLADWSVLIENYIEAHNMALDKGKNKCLR